MQGDDYDDYDDDFTWYTKERMVNSNEVEERTAPRDMEENGRE